MENSKILFTLNHLKAHKDLQDEVSQTYLAAAIEEYNDLQSILQGMKKICQDQAISLEMYSVDNQVPNNAFLVKKLQEKK